MSPNNTWGQLETREGGPTKVSREIFDIFLDKIAPWKSLKFEKWKL